MGDGEAGLAAHQLAQAILDYFLNPRLPLSIRSRSMISGGYLSIRYDYKWVNLPMLPP
jgi:hypothetical protein